MPKTTKTPAESLAEVQQQLRGAALRQQEANLQVERLQLKLNKLLNRHPDLAPDAASSD